MKMERKNWLYGENPKGQSRAKNKKISEVSWANRTEEWKGNDRTALEASMRSSTFSKEKKLNLFFQNAFPWILESITVGLDAWQIAMFRD